MVIMPSWSVYTVTHNLIEDDCGCCAYI